jgi:hypothetical protein
MNSHTQPSKLHSSSPVSTEVLTADLMKTEVFQNVHVEVLASVVSTKVAGVHRHCLGYLSNYDSKISFTSRIGLQGNVNGVDKRFYVSVNAEIADYVVHEVNKHAEVYIKSLS